MLIGWWVGISGRGENAGSVGGVGQDHRYASWAGGRSWGPCRRQRERWVWTWACVSFGWRVESLRFSFRVWEWSDVNWVMWPVPEVGRCEDGGAKTVGIVGNSGPREWEGEWARKGQQWPIGHHSLTLAFTYLGGFSSALLNVKAFLFWLGIFVRWANRRMTGITSWGCWQVVDEMESHSWKCSCWSENAHVIVKFHGFDFY